MKNRELLIGLLDNVIFGKKFTENSDSDLNANALCRLAKMHDLAHLIYDAFLNNGLFPKNEKLKGRLKQEKLFAVYREIRSESVIEILRGLFQKNRIDFILLKGAIIKDLYPEPWMRTSCDIDVLVKETDLERALSILKDEGFTTDNVKNYHDISLFYGNVHVELHYNILENLPNVDDILNKVWEYSVNAGGTEYRELPEFFAFHHIAHMSYHFLSGGCGIRPFIDLKLMKDKNFYDENKKKQKEAEAKERELKLSLTAKEYYAMQTDKYSEHRPHKELPFLLFY